MDPHEVQDGALYEIRIELGARWDDDQQKLTPRVIGWAEARFWGWVEAEGLDRFLVFRTRDTDPGFLMIAPSDITELTPVAE